MKRTIRGLDQESIPSGVKPAASGTYTIPHSSSGLGYYMSSLTLGEGQGLRRAEPLAVC